MPNVTAVEPDSVHPPIAGRTAAEIADSIRSLVERGELRPGVALPSVRAIAESLGVNRNTAVAAYRQLTLAGVVVTRGRGGTSVAEHSPLAQEGFASDSVLRDVATGNPDPGRIPDLTRALTTLAGRPVLYGEPVIDPALEAWARAWMSETPAAPDDVRLTITSGAADAVERLLALALTRDDAVALEDPCFLTSIHTVRVGGYRPVAVPVDDEGMTPEGLREALRQGVRAVVCTPRAQNPTGASLTAERAAQLRAELRPYPYVLVIEDDHFSMLSQRPFHSIIAPDHRRWALVRSMSKFLGPDTCLAVVATDADTADRLATRLSPGTTWVSHLLQRLTLALVGDAEVVAAIDDAGRHYARRNVAFAQRLSDRGVAAGAGDGLSLWVDVGAPARDVSEQLMRRGWLARSGDEFHLAARGPSTRLRLTVHDLDDADADRLADDVAASVRAARGRSGSREVG